MWHHYKHCFDETLEDHAENLCRLAESSSENVSPIASCLLVSLSYQAQIDCGECFGN